MAKPQIHPKHPTLTNPKWTQEVFDSAREPKVWMIVARRLRSSADAIFERETPVAIRHVAELNRIGQLVADGNPTDEYDELEFPFPNFDAAYMLIAYAIENLLKGFAVAKNLVPFSARELSRTIKEHDLYKLHQLVAPKATIPTQDLHNLTYMSEWRARYPCPTTIEKFWPIGTDGIFKAGSYIWPDFNKNILAYYDVLEAELRDFLSHGGNP